VDATPSPPGAGLKAAVVGARRRRQGTGPHLARFLADAGTDVCAIQGTSQATVEDARRELAAAGLVVRGYADLAEMLTREALDVLVVASPHEAHDVALEGALEAGLHVLCEKPLCWGGRDLAARAARYARKFLRRGLHLQVQTQWPWTLPTYRALFPQVLLDAPRTFEMELWPASRGPRRCPDALPHPSSLLAAVLPDPQARVEDPVVRVRGGSTGRVEVHFRYVAAGHEVDARIVLNQGSTTPRPAAYGFDGCIARRVIEPATYTMRLVTDDRWIDLPDPTPLRVRDFLADVSSGAPPRVDLAIVPGMDHLVRIAEVWPA